MSIRKIRLLGLVIMVAMFTLIVDGEVNSWARAPAPLVRDHHTRTYRFTARIKSNAGVTPFKVADLIKGTFTYDLRAKNKLPADAPYGSYSSKQNSFAFQLGDLQFTSIGEVGTWITVDDGVEDFSIRAHDVQIPKGWEVDHTGRSQSYGLQLQNVPTKQVFRRVEMPDRLSLKDFVSTREVRLDFFHGVRFPGGQVKGRATVIATVESLDEVRR
jgi:hypothetical protein